jgi:tyrosinase
MNNSSGVLHVRREVRSLGPGDPTLPRYADAIAEMQKGAEETDPISWLFQAAMHGTENKPTSELAREFWNKCNHGSWYFVSWHRMYVYFFEEIVRSYIVKLHGQQAGDEWALPYWNYCRGGEFASIPDAFRPETVDGEPNPLFVKQRRPGINQGLQMPGTMTESNRALARPHFIGTAEFGGGEAPPNEQFWRQGGVLEQTPHNSVHGGVGGGGWMGNILQAAKDPIFWLHHANIDRIWSQWLAQPQPKRENPSSPKWTGQHFKFLDAEGKPASFDCEEVTGTEKLGYKYDALDGAPSGPPPPPSPSPVPIPEGEAAVPASVDPPTGPKFVGLSEEKVTLTGEPEAIPVGIDERSRDEVREASRKADPRHLYLNIEDIEGEENPGTVYGIYVNLPKGADEETKAKHHVGNVSFFGIELAGKPIDDEHPHNMRVSVEVGELLRVLGGGEHFAEEQIYVTFCPLTLEAPEGKEEEYAHLTAEPKDEAPIHIGRVSLAIDA